MRKKQKKNPLVVQPVSTKSEFTQSFVESVKPWARLAGHTTSCIIGFVVMILGMVIPMELVKCLDGRIDVDTLNVLRHVEVFSVYADVVVFAFTWLFCLFVFVRGEWSTIRQRKSHLETKDE